MPFFKPRPQAGNRPQSAQQQKARPKVQHKPKKPRKRCASCGGVKGHF